MSQRLRLFAALILSAAFAQAAGAQSSAERLRALGDEMVQREFDFLPAPSQLVGHFG